MKPIDLLPGIFVVSAILIYAHFRKPGNTASPDAPVITNNIILDRTQATNGPFEVTYEPQAFPPWSIVKSEDGRYTFTDERGEPRHAFSSTDRTNVMFWLNYALESRIRMESAKRIKWQLDTNP